MTTKYKRAMNERYDLEVEYSPVDAVRISKEAATAKFDETIEVHFSLGIDPRHADQLVRVR